MCECKIELIEIELFGPSEYQFNRSLGNINVFLEKCLTLMVCVTVYPSSEVTEWCEHPVFRFDQ